ncbi:RNase adapter RapZ [Oleiagrimonas sp. C23AA]|uniref:RNase adapter RapZ n=1 Tax=Oleiagrimonas sp. C23AA TaxID=2719047 RepID=UPI001420B76F|nr:RNase adapter RapZ [Oleiagrimonas sp. C23AA]NII11517.1 RNase adapter RapZ [Oleiagrimonas sp. C23AA]
MSEQTDNPTHVIVLTGMSGGGKTIALRALEDLDFYCVDNLPAALLPELVETVDTSRGDERTRIAVGIDVRSEDLERIPGMLSQLESHGVTAHLIFVDSRDEVLIKRYSETRRRHPLAQPKRSLADAIAEERQLLRPLIGIAEHIIDTSELNVHQLRRLIATEFAARSEGMTVMFESFAFKKGLPLDADFVFDARCLPNPHWDRALRPLSGKDAPVREYLDAQPEAVEYFNDIMRFLESWLPRFEKADRSYLTVSVGCTGGRHRSVYLVERLTDALREHHHEVISFHRELD